MSRNVSESIALMLAAESISMEELVDARLSLEVPIAGRAAVNADDEVVARLEAAIEAAVGHQPGTRAFQRSRQPLPPDPRRGRGERPAARAERPGSWRCCSRRWWRTSRASVDAETILDQHRAILRAVRRHQRSAAERAMQAHIEYLSDVLRELG